MTQAIFSAREVLSAIRDMDPACGQVHLQPSTSEGLEEGLMEEREASPPVSLDEETATMANDVTEDTSMVRLETNVVKVSGKEEASVQDSAVQDSPDKVQADDTGEDVATGQTDTDTPPFRVESNVVVYMEDELEELEDVETCETQKPLLQDGHVKKEEGGRAFFYGLWELITWCFYGNTKD